LRPPVRTEMASGAFEESDDEWKIERVDKKEDVVELYNARRGVRITLRQDHIHGYTSDPTLNHKGDKRGFLTLVRIQIKITANNSYSVEPLPMIREKIEPAEVIEASSRRNTDEEKILRHLADVPGFIGAEHVSRHAEISIQKTKYYLDKMLKENLLETPMIHVYGDERSYKLGHHGRGYLITYNLID